MSQHSKTNTELISSSHNSSRNTNGRPKQYLVVLLILMLLYGCAAPGQIEDQGSNVASTLVDISLLDIDRAYDVVEELSQSKYDGRLSGTPENLRAAEYIASEFERIGLVSPKGIEEYYQYFDHKNTVMKTGSSFDFISMDDETEVALIPHVDVRDMVRFSGTLASGQRIGEMVHVTSMDDFDTFPQALGGKILLINHEVYDPYNPDRLLRKAMQLTPKPTGIFIHQENKYNEYFLVSKYLPAEIQTSEFDNENGPGVFYLTGEAFTKCLDAIRDGKRMQYSIDYEYSMFTVPNIVGYKPATSAEPAGTILFGAHFDHVGTNGDGTYNPGALDNASGVAAILEIARVLTQSELDHDYNYAFIAFNGEEEFLFGSNHYVNHPLFPLDETTFLNFDMVGSSRPIPLNINVNNFALGDTQDTLIETSKSLGISAVKDFGGTSDNVPFESSGVDSVLLIHLDMSDIHTRLDTADNVDPERLGDVIKLVLQWLNETKVN